jgi:enoyl-CoA hydratase/carnithine racemase
MIKLERQEDVFVLSLGDGDNRFDGDTVPALGAALDEIEAASGPAALVTTATGKIWSNGLDIDHLGAVDDPVAFVAGVEAVFARLLRLPLFTVAAIGGHAFAAGAMLALAHDVRVMRADRGYFCLPEVDLGMRFTDGFAALIGAKLAQPALHRLAVMGERLPAPAALDLGVIDAVAPEDAVLSTAMARAAELAPRGRSVLGGIRRNFYAPVIAALDPPADGANR